MPIPLSSTIIPKNDIPAATHDSKYAVGGRREVDTISGRNAITTERRSSGMEVYVRADQKKYILQNNLTSWIEDPLTARVSNAEAALLALNKTSVGLSLVDNTADSTKPVSGPQQTAIDAARGQALAASQPLSGNLTNLSGVTNTSYGRSLLTLSDAPALRTSIGYKLNNRSTDSTGNFSTYAYVGPWVEKPAAYLFSGRKAFFTDIGINGSDFISVNARWKPMSPVVLYKTTSDQAFTPMDTVRRPMVTYMLPGGLMGADSFLDIQPHFVFTNASPDRTLSVEFGGQTAMSYLRTTAGGVQASPVCRIYNRFETSSGQYTPFAASRNFSPTDSSTVTSLLSVNTRLDTLITVSIAFSSAGDINTQTARVRSCLIILY